MKATINGRERELPEGLSFGALLDLVGPSRIGIAVARNDCVVRRDAYDSELVNDGDRVEIIEAVAGG